MAIFSKIIEGDDFRQLTITKTTEPFPSAASRDVLKVRDEQGTLWKFNSKVKSRSKWVLSGPHWEQFLHNNGVQIGHKIAFDYNDAWCPEADFKIEVIT